MEQKLNEQRTFSTRFEQTQMNDLQRESKVNDSKNNCQTNTSPPTAPSEKTAKARKTSLYSHSKLGMHVTSSPDWRPRTQ